MKLAALSALVATTVPVFAGGMVLPFRGVRDAERGGALVAGADDADAIWLNPAGIARLDRMTLSIATMYVDQQVDYARVDSGGNQMDTISNDHPGQPIPAIGFVAPIGDKLVIGGGTWTPYAGLHRYSIDGAQRYGSISIAQTKILHLTFAAAYRVNDRLRVGATIQNMVTALDSRVVLSGCPGQTICAPEDPEFDSDARLQQTDLFAPTGSLGVQFDAHPQVTIGAMFQLPASISGADGKLSAKLPSSGFYEGATLVGDRASIEMDLPASLHVGVEYRPLPTLRLEAALHVELWGTHDAITFTPRDVRIENVAGVGTYELGSSVIPRNYETSYAPAIGGEYAIDRFSVGAGYSYETAAAPAGYVSALTVDSAKHLVGIGGAFHAPTWTVGATVAFAKLADVDVALDEARVPQLSPVRGQPADVMINAGRYESTYVLAGVRVTKAF